MLTNDEDIEVSKKYYAKMFFMVCIIAFITLLFCSVYFFGGISACNRGGGVLVGFPSFKCIPEGCPLQCDNICTTNSSFYNYRVFLE